MHKLTGAAKTVF